MKYMHIPRPMVGWSLRMVGREDSDWLGRPTSGTNQQELCFESCSFDMIYIYACRCLFGISYYLFNLYVVHIFVYINIYIYIDGIYILPIDEGIHPN